MKHRGKDFMKANSPKPEAEFACHRLLSRLMVEVAMERHAGRIEMIYGPTGEKLIQHGKDLTGVKTVIGTGGPIIFSATPAKFSKAPYSRKKIRLFLNPKIPSFTWMSSTSFTP